MPRESSDSISFVVQALFSDADAVKPDNKFRFNTANLIESSDRYGYLFLCLGASLHVFSVPKAEDTFNGEESAFDSNVSFKIDFPGQIVQLSLSRSENHIAVAAGGVLSILSVPNLLITVSIFLFIKWCNICNSENISEISSLM